jgi:small subunit ribosomal protein S6
MAAKRLYEGMFLVDSALATGDWDGTLATIENILRRADAEVVAIRKWGERKLAYDIDHKSRGTYILTYFKADGRRISGIEKDVQLSEKVMRCLILTTEKRPPELIEQDIAGLPKDDVPAEGARDGEEAREPERRPERRPRDLSDEPADIPELDEPADEVE